MVSRCYAAKKPVSASLPGLHCLHQPSASHGSYRWHYQFVTRSCAVAEEKPILLSTSFKIDTTETRHNFQWEKNIFITQNSRRFWAFPLYSCNRNRSLWIAWLLQLIVTPLNCDSAGECIFLYLRPNFDDLKAAG